MARRSIIYALAVPALEEVFWVPVMVALASTILRHVGSLRCLLAIGHHCTSYERIGREGIYGDTMRPTVLIFDYFERDAAVVECSRLHPVFGSTRGVAVRVEGSEC
jgi:hypothetical protein